MGQINIEIKARVASQVDLDTISEIIMRQPGATFQGIDNQTDTYFKVSDGRLKVREGNIENCVVFYRRPNQQGPKKSELSLVHLQDIQTPSVKDLLETIGFPLKVVVDKVRKIYFIDNVKFHLDSVAGLGRFVEIEAIDRDGSIGEEKLHNQCNQYLYLLGIKSADLEPKSYSDLLLGK